MQRETNPLTTILEQARALQLRQGMTAREALALALANERRARRELAATDAGDHEVMRISMPAGACLDARLPRHREPSIEEIREAWQECMEQPAAFSGGP